MENTPALFEIDGRDVAMDRLRILNDRQKINLPRNQGYKKIVATIRAIGLIEPLSVYPEGDDFIVLDGFLRLVACRDMGLTSMPCVVYKDKQAYTFNRNVNRLSSFQESRMLRKSLETVDEATIAKTFGIKSIRARLLPNLARQLHPDMVEAFKEGTISKLVAGELMRVNHARQVEIFAEMKKVGDFGPTFCRALVIQTPPAQRTRAQRERKSWAEDGERKRDLLGRLTHAEQQHDFYAKLYRQYSSDLLKATFYVRKLISTPQIVGFLQANYPDVLTRFRSVVELVA